MSNIDRSATPKVKTLVAPTDPQNNHEESFERRVMAACWGIPDPEDVECPILKEAAETMQELSEERPELVPDKYNWDYVPVRDHGNPYCESK